MQAGEVTDIDVYHQACIRNQRTTKGKTGCVNRYSMINMYVLFINEHV